jgi:hypothetical protein
MIVNAVSFSRTKLERKDARRVQQLREMMETLLDHIVPELLRGSRVQKLLATPREVAFGSEQVAFAKVEQNVTSQEVRWDDDYLDQMIMQSFESLTCPPASRQRRPRPC